MLRVFYGVKYNFLWCGTQGPSDLALFTFRLFPFYTSPCMWLLKQQNNGILVSLLHPPLTSHPTVLCLRLQILPWWWLSSWELMTCVTKSTGDLHSKVMDTWNTPASLAGPLLTAFWVLCFFPTHTSTFFPRTLSYAVLFYFFFCFS